MSTSSISIVTCSYQQGKYLDATIRSVLEQNYPNLEYLIIDGGSTDGSVDIIKRYASHLAYWVSEPDGGQTKALIEGFRRSQGEIMGWLCSDDLLLPIALKTVAEFFAAHPDVYAAYGDSLWIDGDSNYIRCKREMPFYRFVFFYDHNYVPQPSMFWRRSLYDAVGGLDERFNFAMDADLWERFSARAKIAHVPKYLSCLRFYAEQKTTRLHSESRREDALIRTRSPLAKGGAFAYPFLHALARFARVSRKLAAGGYGAKAPQQHVDWLKKFAQA
ncbi:MAG: glycosyltransferase family 2 protein [Pyrinomonadaceae bacterium]